MKKAKQFIGFILTLIMMMSVVCVGNVAVSAKTYSGTKGSMKWILNDSSGTLTILSQDGTETVIPDYISTKPGWYEYKDKIKSIIIRTNITKIGKKAFYGLNKTTSLEIGKKVSEIGTLAFGQMSALKTYKVTSGNKSFKANLGILFTYDGTQLVAYPPNRAGEEYTIPDAVKKIRSYAFYGNKNLLRVKNQSDTLKTVSAGAFSYCDKLRNVYFHNGLENLGLRTFTGSESLIQVTLPPSIQAIDDNGKTLFSESDKMKAMSINCAVNSKIYNLMVGKGYNLVLTDYTIRCLLDVNGGELDDQEYIDVVYGKPYGELPEPERMGYEFKGWYYDNKLIEKTTIVTAAKKHMLKAVYEGNQYDLEINPNGGVCDKTSITVTYGEPIGTLPTVTREGFIYLGWYDDNGNRVYENDIYEDEEITTLTAKWRKIIDKTTGLSISYKTKYTVKLTWNKQDGVSGYKVYKKANKGEYKLCGTVDKNEFVTKKLSGKKTYRFKVRAYYLNENEETEDYGKYSIVVKRVKTYTVKPALKCKYVKSRNAYNVTWKSTGAKAFEIYQKKNGKWKKVAVTTSIKSFLFPRNGRKYAFKVRGYKKVLGHKYYSGFSKIVK